MHVIAGVLAQRRTLVASLLTTLAVGALLFGTLLPRVAGACGAPAPDTQPFTSPSVFASFLDACGEGGRAAYRDLQLADLLYPAALATFLGSAITFAAGGRGDSRLAWLPLLPIGSSTADYLENASAWTALATYPDVPAIALAVFSGAAAVKWTFGWASWLVLLALLGRRAGRRLRGAL